jgi:outer membrane protein
VTRWFLSAFLAIMVSQALAQKQITLQEAISLSSSSSPAILAAKAEAAAAKEAVAMRRAALFPQLSANGFAVDSKVGTIFQSGPGRMTSSIAQLPMGQTWMGSIMLMLPLFTGGVLNAELAESQALERSAQADLKEMQGEAALMTEEAFLMVLLADSEIEAAVARVTAAQEMVRTMRAKFEAGTMTEASVNRAEAEKAMAERMKSMAENEKGKAILELQALLGQDMSEAVSVAGSLDSSDESYDLDDLIKSARDKRGIVLRAKAGTEAAESKVKSALGSSQPAVFLQAMSDRSSNSMMNGSSIGLTFTMPLFDAGERRSQAKEARLMVERARQLQKQAELTAEKEVRQAWLDLNTAKVNIASSKLGIFAAESAYEVARLRVEAGKSLLVEQLDSLQMLTDARTDLAKSRFSYRLAMAKIRRAAGLSLGEKP